MGTPLSPASSTSPNGQRAADCAVELQVSRNSSEEFMHTGLLPRSASSNPGGRRNHPPPSWLWGTLTAANAVALLLSIAALAVAVTRTSAPGPVPTLPEEQAGSLQPGSPGENAGQPTNRTISRIALGSCTSYDLRPQPIWTEGIIPSAPDAWIWLGDFAYLDDPEVDCGAAPQLCNCTLDYMRSSYGMCNAGNLDHARKRMAHQINAPEYREFLAYMCPEATAFPPPGTDPTVCPRPILGVYDDHDYGYNNANGRLPDKDRFKSLYLDAIGESPSSPRRNANRGLWGATTFNPGQPGREVQVVLLDERYNRDTLPCQMRRAWCQQELRRSPGDAWCRDFLVDDGRTGMGSCCFKDEQLAEWCVQAGNVQEPLYRALCDPTSAEFGMRAVAVRSNVTVASVQQAPDAVPRTWELVDPAEAWQNATLRAEVWRWLTQDSPFCDVLGSAQRQWLRTTLGLEPSPDTPPPAQPPAVPALRIIASGSVPFGSLKYRDIDVSTGGTSCSGDDLACYTPAQVNLLHTLANATRNAAGQGGCVVILTGDYHHSDIKVVMPGAGTQYADVLQTEHLPAPVYQLMASGMTDSTALGDELPCQGSYLKDLVGLRPGGPCWYTPYPNFGTVDIDWDARVVSLQIRDVKGAVARSLEDGRPLQLNFSLDTCLPV